MDKRRQTELIGYLKELNLRTVCNRFEDLAREARKESLSYGEYLFLVIQEESQARRQKRIERWLKESHIPLEKKMDTFELKCLPNKVKQQLRILLAGHFLDHKENILIFGNPGSGKTHMACALGQELIRQNKKAYFTTCALLLQELLAAKRSLKLPKLLKKLNKYPVLIIDDIGYVQQEKEEMEVLFTLLAERYERGSVVITSNLPFSKWEQIFKDPMMTAAAIDRIVHHSVIVELNISSYRMLTAKNRKAQERR
ncbi:MAG: IS21-like element helper ATPase IstB [Candidatus Omnitrophica bacterium]|nr:IS21-like element helper ATPase IstB [Candidatus Omnitrophota bacterium]MBU0897473.1 IS21-like element helper ATPase IstB [Candidatus Omnitrophota bacterium]MBU1134882.1 IS21-like element helper ATPase IstB [Candidatus Omnitrophota bacterium]MBU1367814.1 IS21-like element helper ATPase IstB [Candidatus Omnitrophota bacterium]MBU1524717.1 IS21-like element helper ATPase IstB [Candidatus Omnitrophota bacterium]